MSKPTHYTPWVGLLILFASAVASVMFGLAALLLIGVYWLGALLGQSDAYRHDDWLRKANT